jgi:hypothetical protein
MAASRGGWEAIPGWVLEAPAPPPDQPTGGDSIDPQNPDREGITSLVNEALQKDPCAQFAEKILATFSSSKNPALRGGDLFSIFQLFLEKGGSFTRTMPPGSAGYGNPIGSIPTGAMISMGTFSDPALQNWSDAVTVIGELFHLSGSKEWYSDEELAKAVHGIAGYAALSNLKPHQNIFDPNYTGNEKDKDAAYSNYFHDIERTLCPVTKP